MRVGLGERVRAAAREHAWCARARRRRRRAALTFLQLRQQIHTVQAVVGGEASVVAFAGALPKESVVDVCAEATCGDVPIRVVLAAARRAVVKKIFCVSRPSRERPGPARGRRAPSSTAAEEAAEAPAAAAGGEARPRVNQDVRLNDPRARPAHAGEPGDHAHPVRRVASSSAASSSARASPRSTRPSGENEAWRAAPTSSRSSTRRGTSRSPALYKQRR